MVGDDLNQCLHVYCHGLVAIYLHQTEALIRFSLLPWLLKYTGRVTMVATFINLCHCLLKKTEWIKNECHGCGMIAFYGVTVSK